MIGKPVTESPNGSVAPEWVPHVNHLASIHGHYHPMIGKERRKCSGRWFCEKDKTWVEGPKCGEK